MKITFVTLKKKTGNPKWRQLNVTFIGVKSNVDRREEVYIESIHFYFCKQIIVTLQQVQFSKLVLINYRDQHFP